jgi:hypothetical protein
VSLQHRAEEQLRQATDRLEEFHDRMFQENGFVCRDSICRLCGDKSYVPRVQPPDGATSERALALLDECAGRIGVARIIFPARDEVLARYRLAIGDGEGRFSYWYRNGGYVRSLSRNEALDRVELMALQEIHGR